MGNLFPEYAQSIGNDQKGAIFSDDRKYRYALWRIWDENLPSVAFIGLNPSTANESTDDPTIKRVVQIAKNLGYGSVWMLNLFAIVSADPKVLQTCSDPIRDNDRWLLEFTEETDVICAWGNFKEAEQRAKEVLRMLPQAKALHINKNGSPKHPLYCRADIQPVAYKMLNSIPVVA